MKNSILALITVCILLSGQSLAQTKSFKLSNYKLPQLKRKALDINFDLKGKNSNEKITPENVDPKEYNKSDFNGSGNFKYTSYYNSAEKQQETYANFLLTTSLYSQKNYDGINGHKYKSSGFHPRIEFNSINRYYFKPDKFYEINYRLYSGFDNNRFKRWEYEIKEEDSQHKYRNFSLSLPLKAGKGRIEQVQDARQAIYIIDALKKENKITKAINDEDILNLAAFISELKNKRFFDSRLRRIAELEAIDHFLSSNNFISEIDSRYFTTLLDFWEYGGNQVRNSGKRFSFSLTPEYGYNTYKNNSITHTIADKNINNLRISGGLEYERHKPVSLSWQNYILLYAFFYHERTKVDLKPGIQKTRTNNIQAGFVQSFAYYPSTRTSAWLHYSIRYSRNFEKDLTEETKTNADYISAYSGFEFNYYISPQLSLNFFTRIYYNLNKDTHWYNDPNEAIAQSSFEFSEESKYRRFEPEFSLGLVYSIF